MGPGIRLILPALLGALCQGCAKGHEHIVQIDPAFTTEYNQFISDSATVGRAQAPDDLIIKFGNPSDYCYEGAAGCCYQHDNETPQIIIDEATWNQLDAWDVTASVPAGTEKTILLYHELGHCVLGLQHDTATHSGGPGNALGPGEPIPASLMEPNFNGDWLPYNFMLYRGEYISQLFGVGPGPEPFGP